MGIRRGPESMAIEIRLPQAGMGMKEGILLRWLRGEGDQVSEGDPVVEVETMKAVLEIQSPGNGVLGGLAYVKGDTVPVREVMAWVLAPGETAPSGAAGESLAESASGKVTASSRKDSNRSRRQVLPTARKLALEYGVDLDAINGSGPGGRIVDDDVLGALTPPSAPPADMSTIPEGTLKEASSLAQRLGSARGVDPRDLAGTGPAGRVMKVDVERASPSGHRGHDSDTQVPMTPMRQTIASRMHQSLQESAQLTLHADADAEGLVALREALIEQWAPYGARPTYQDFLIVAIARALRMHPTLNAVLEGDRIRLLGRVCIGFAVSVTEGLVVPVLQQTDELSLRDVCTRTRELADQSLKGVLPLRETVGGSFTVTSLGGAAIKYFTPILNPPQVGILGVGTIYDSTSWSDSTPHRQRRLPLSLTIDHRVVDGSPGAAFLSTLCGFVSQPLSLLT